MNCRTLSSAFPSSLSLSLSIFFSSVYILSPSSAFSLPFPFPISFNIFILHFLVCVSGTHLGTIFYELKAYFLSSFYSLLTDHGLHTFILLLFHFFLPSIFLLFLFILYLFFVYFFFSTCFRTAVLSFSFPLFVLFLTLSSTNSEF